jgi:exopolyphosphatase/guanosine-5'-triphosphate,3'-diphosphate pyrophosphatase
MVALIARYHRRSPPERGRPDLEALSAAELRLLRRLVALLRIADALDRSHHQPVEGLRASARPGLVQVSARARGDIDLELWDVEREAAWFRRAMGRRIAVQASRR